MARPTCLDAGAGSARAVEDGTVHGRHHTLTRSSVWALPAGWHLSQILGWICLLVVPFTTAYGLELAAAPLVPSGTATADQLDASKQFLGSHEVNEQRGALLLAASASSPRIVLMTGQDATTGDRMQMECITANDRIASDALLVELKDFPAVAAQVCNVANAPAVRP
jgi:hypothetical protein